MVEQAAGKQVRLDLKSGGWALLLSLALSAAAVAWAPSGRLSVA